MYAAIAVVWLPNATIGEGISGVIRISSVVYAVRWMRKRQLNRNVIIHNITITPKSTERNKKININVISAINEHNRYQLSFSVLPEATGGL